MSSVIWVPPNNLIPQKYMIWAFRSFTGCCCRLYLKHMTCLIKIKSIGGLVDKDKYRWSFNQKSLVWVLSEIILLPFTEEYCLSVTFWLLVGSHIILALLFNLCLAWFGQKGTWVDFPVRPVRSTSIFQLYFDCNLNYSLIKFWETRIWLWRRTTCKQVSVGCRMSLDGLLFCTVNCSMPLSRGS